MFDKRFPAVCTQRFDKMGKPFAIAFPQSDMKALHLVGTHQLRTNACNFNIV